ncbi:MAG: hypothetical protein U0168_27080 [Nannocystaceae bacterium]
MCQGTGECRQHHRHRRFDGSDGGSSSSSGSGGSSSTGAAGDDGGLIDFVECIFICMQDEQVVGCEEFADACV